MGNRQSKPVAPDAEIAALFAVICLGYKTGNMTREQVLVLLGKQQQERDTR